MLHACTVIATPVAFAYGRKSWSRGSPTGRNRLPVFRHCSTAGPKEVAFAAAVFEPLKETERDLFQLPQEHQKSLARLNFEDSCLFAINDQINVIYSLSYIYHSLYAYFDRDNVALLGFANYFKDESDHRRKRAEELMMYQNKRGGRVKMNTLLVPEVLEFDEVRKFMELAQSLEKLSTQKFYALQQAAEEAQDKHLSHLVKSQYLAEQIETVKRLSEYVTQLRLIGEDDGHGIYYVDGVFGKAEA